MIFIMANKHNSLPHTKWLCKYHIVFTPKYRCKCQNKSVNKFQDKNVQKIYNIDILKKGDIYDIRNKNTN